MKEVKERHWNRTVADLAAAKSKLASTVEDILSKTAARLIAAKQNVGAFKEDVKNKTAAKLAQLKSKAAAKMVETKVKMDEAKDAVAAAVGAGVAKVVETVQVVVGLKKAAVAKVIGKVKDVSARIQQHKAEKKQQLATAKLSFVPVTTVVPARAAKPVQIVAKTESVFHWHSNFFLISFILYNPATWLQCPAACFCEYYIDSTFYIVFSFLFAYCLGNWTVSVIDIAQFVHRDDSARTSFTMPLGFVFLI